MKPKLVTESAAKRLTGLTLEGGWKVQNLIEPSPVATGGCFSSGYELESTSGKRAFLKALDYSRAFKSPDPAQALKAMTTAYLFERDLLDRCNARGLNRVVTAMASGKIILDNDPAAGLVEYLIFEKADGDVRQLMDALHGFDLHWTLVSLRQVAAALKQLHGEFIAHQDLKPSNVLVFSEDSKLADLGRAACRDLVPPHEELRIPGDRSYAPLELLYGYVSQEWAVRRLGCDLYLLGSMVVWFFCGLGVTALTISKLDQSLHPGVWQGSYETVLPHIRHAFSSVLVEFRSQVPEKFADELTVMVEQLCEPDPARRGHPKNQRGRNSSHSLERFISKFDLLAAKARYI